MNQNKLPSLEEFKTRLTCHEFSLAIWNDMHSGFPRDPKEQMMAQYVRAQRIEATLIFPDAWAGGDEYMQALGEAQAKAVNHITKEEIRKNVPTYHLERKVFEKLGTALQEFIKKLYYHDWHYSYSDDANVWRGGQKKRDEIDAILKTGGDEYKVWYNKMKPDDFNAV